MISSSGSWLLSASDPDASASVLGVPLWAFPVLGYLVAAVMGLWLVIAIVRSGRLS